MVEGEEEGAGSIVGKSGLQVSYLLLSLNSWTIEGGKNYGNSLCLSCLPLY